MAKNLNRREFLAAAAAVPALSAITAKPVFAEETHHDPPYLALEKFIQPGHDEFSEEKIAAELAETLRNAVLSGNSPPVGSFPHFSSPLATSFRKIAPDLRQAVFSSSSDPGSFPQFWKSWRSSLGKIRRAQFYPLPENEVRFEIASERDGQLLYRVGLWRVAFNNGKLESFAPLEEHVASSTQPFFRDVTAAAFEKAPSFAAQLSRGIPYWRSRLDPASGIDIYGSNGIAVGDIDNDGFDEIYVCQPGGLPNRLYKFNSESQLIDITESWGVGILDDTSSALFLDLRNSGRQDLVVLRSTGPLLFVNEGGRFHLREDAFRFATPPAGAFTGMAAADFDRDGKLDLYLCCYVYFQSEAQYTYATPYHDAQNGPPNFLFRNKLNPDGSGFLEDCTEETGINENNTRFSFAPAWCDFNGDGWPDLYVANDFGRKNLYLNHNGRFRDMAAQAGVEDIGPGMSAAWFDYNHDGQPDLYVGNMWTASGQRVIADPNFAPAKTAPDAYRGHTMGNSLYRNRGDGTFENRSAAEHVQFGRWAWSSGGHDFDNDGDAEIFITCGMLTNTSEAQRARMRAANHQTELSDFSGGALDPATVLRDALDTDLGSFFWRQVVAKSPATAQPSPAYENGWNAINQFMRQEYSWNGHEPNVLHVRRGDRYYDFSGVSGLDWPEDSRAFAVVDFDGDGRPDIILKSRLGPQVRVLQNNCAGSNHSIAFELRGTKSNRDAIGARVQVDSQTKWLDAGSGFLSQHSKRLLFGLGSESLAKRVQITWPSGITQAFTNLAAGFSYTVTEDSAQPTAKKFCATAPLASRPVDADNSLRLEDTWLLEPVPLPEPQHGPGLFVITESNRSKYEIFRRYLFDWRTSLVTPFALLLNSDGQAIKVYANVPSQAVIDADLHRPGSGLPFAGTYINRSRRDYFKFGAAYLWAGYYDEALPYLDLVLKRTPDNARVLVLVGQIQLHAGRTQTAADVFRRAIDVNPGYSPAWTGAGQTAAILDQQQRAAECYRKALELQPDSAEAANGLGLALAKQNSFEEAKKYLERAIELKRDYADAINNLGVLYIHQGKINDAIAALQYGIGVAPTEDILYLNLGRIYTQRGDFEKARQVMQQLLDKKPDDGVARRALQDLAGR